MAEPLRLLVVCLGNICRSPLGEGVLRARIEVAGLDRQVVVDSAGTGHWHAGEPPDARAVETALHYGVDISKQRARALCDEDYTRFDWLLCADRANLRDVRRRAPADASAGTALLMEWAGQGAREVPDPYTGGIGDFHKVWRMLDAAAQAMVADPGALLARRGQVPY